MNANHTPGPWFVADGEMFKDGMPRIATKGLSVAQICLTFNGTQEANARLIASAPDLLAALEIMVEAGRMTVCGEIVEPGKGGYHTGKGLGRAFEVARAAIAQAKGE